MEINGELHYDMTLSAQAASGTYRPLEFSNDALPVKQVRNVCVAIFATYFGQWRGVTAWKKQGRASITWRDHSAAEHQSKPFSFDDVCIHLRETGSFDPGAFGLGPLLSPWLDGSVEISPRFHAPAVERRDVALTFYLPTSFSESFPLHAQLDREGRAFSSLQLVLLKALSDVRRKLVTSSDELFGGAEWLQNLFNYLNTAIACVDNTLHQLYYRAKYEAAKHPGWTFDEAMLGQPYRTRMRDKLAWVGQITGKPLDNCPVEISAFLRLKRVRNHLNHFDPPVLAFSIEDVADWLSVSSDIAKLLFQIRLRAGAPLCVPLVELLLAPAIRFVPFDPAKQRVPQKAGVGYGSTTWDAPAADGTGGVT
jgi:hypothetical protein